MITTRGIAIICVLAAATGAAGCSRRWTAKVTQPALVLDATRESRTSMPLTIMLRDVDTGRLRLANTAYYVVVSRDRLRFHITLHHKWDEIADVQNWKVYIEDAKGRRHYPEHVDGNVEHITMWKRNGVTYSLHKPLYRGTADLTIYHRNLFAAGKKVTLVMTRGSYEYRYVWISKTEDEEESRTSPTFGDVALAQPR